MLKDWKCDNEKKYPWYDCHNGCMWDWLALKQAERDKKIINKPNKAK
jgi:hypothetical protein